MSDRFFTDSAAEATQMVRLKHTMQSYTGKQKVNRCGMMGK